jgi:hypothetical protein
MTPRKQLLFCTMVVLVVIIGGASAIPASGHSPIQASPTPDSSPPVDLTSWNFYDPHDPTLSTILTSDPQSEDGTALRLDPTWDVARVEFLYEHWSFGTTIQYEVLEKGASGFTRDGEAIFPTLVENLLNAISNLHPAQLPYYSYFHTDDYPTWMLEITGQDGQRLLLYASSNGNPGYGPWTVFYNGRVYTQFTGKLADAIARIFVDGEEDRLDYKYGDFAEGKTAIFSTDGLPNQFRSAGFVGLLSIANYFQYEVIPSQNTIHGYVEGQNAFAISDWLLQGTLIELTEISLTFGDGTFTDCTIERVESDHEIDHIWEFTCNVPQMPINTRYDIPIRVTAASEDGTQVTAEGRLQGTWSEQDSLLWLPLPEFLQQGLAAYPDAADLLKDHAAYAYFDAEIDINDPYNGAFAGEVILLGQTIVDGQTIRYTMGTPFAMNNGTLTWWKLDRTKLEELLTDIVSISVLSQAIERDADVILNMWYGEDSEGWHSLALPIFGRQGGGYDDVISNCDDSIELGKTHESQPYRAFNFNSSWRSGIAQIAFDGDQPISLDIHSFSSRFETNNPLLPIFVPVEFIVDGSLLGDGFDYSQGRNPRLEIRVYSTDAERIRQVEAHLANLHIPFIKVVVENRTVFAYRDIVFQLTDEGTMGIKVCPSVRNWL